MIKVNIRTVEEKDIREVVKLQIAGWQTAYRGIIDDEFLDNMDLDKMTERRKNDYKNSEFIVAELDGEIVSFSRYIYGDKVESEISDINSEIIALYVKPDLKRCGIGKQVIKYIFNDLKSRNSNNVILWCLKDNIPSRRFYEAMGGTIVGEHDITFGEKVYKEVGFKFVI